MQLRAIRSPPYNHVGKDQTLNCFLPPKKHVRDARLCVVFLATKAHTHIRTRLGPGSMNSNEAKGKRTACGDDHHYRAPRRIIATHRIARTRTTRLGTRYEGEGGASPPHARNAHAKRVHMCREDRKERECRCVCVRASVSAPPPTSFRRLIIERSTSQPP